MGDRLRAVHLPSLFWIVAPLAMTLLSVLWLKEVPQESTVLKVFADHLPAQWSGLEVDRPEKWHPLSGTDFIFRRLLAGFVHFQATVSLLHGFPPRMASSRL